MTHDLPVHPLYRPMVGGGTVGDFNNDGWQDLFILSGGVEPDKLYINNGDGTFTDQAISWGVARIHQGIGACVGDYDGNGWIDIYATSHAPSGAIAPAPGAHVLYHNNGDGTFSEVAEKAGVNFGSAQTDGFGAAFGDYDLDGDLDLALAGWAISVGGSRLFRNNGDETFTDVTPVLNHDVTIKQGFSPGFYDMTDDRYPELLFVADYGTSRYFLNLRDGTFFDRTPGSGTGDDQNGMGSTVGDFNNDGRFDWFVTSIYLQGNPAMLGNMLYINVAPNRFVESSDLAGVSDGAWGWGTVAVDFDHDTHQDIGETNGWLSPPWIGEMNRLYMNNGDGTFTESAAAMGFDFSGDGRGLVNFDYDNDGDQDTVIFPNEEAIELYRNDLTGPDTNWLRIFLDTSADPALAPNGFGTRVEVTANGTTQCRYISGGSSYLSVSELSAHFGLGAAGTADVRVEWADGSVVALQSVATNQTMTIASGRPGSRAQVGDLNGDGVVSLSDVDYVADCTKGPSGHIYSGCGPADWDSDEDADLQDYAIWQQVLGAAAR